MGLEDLVPEEAQGTSSKDYSRGNVKSRMKPKNVERSELWWKHTILHSPGTVAMMPNELKEAELRLFIQLFDEVMKGEVRGVKVGDEAKDRIELERETLVEELKRRNSQ